MINYINYVLFYFLIISSSTKFSSSFSPKKNVTIPIITKITPIMGRTDLSAFRKFLSKTAYAIIIIPIAIIPNLANTELRKLFDLRLKRTYTYIYHILSNKSLLIGISLK